MRGQRKEKSGSKVIQSYSLENLFHQQRGYIKCKAPEKLLKTSDETGSGESCEVKGMMSIERSVSDIE